MADEFEAARQRERLRIAYANTFRSEDGQIVLHDLLERCGAFAPYVPNMQADGNALAIHQAWSEGRRSVPLDILARLNMTANDAVKIHKEMMDAMGGRQRMDRAISDAPDD